MTIPVFGWGRPRHVVTDIADLPNFRHAEYTGRSRSGSGALGLAVSSEQDVKANKSVRGEKRMFKHLLVPTDGSALSEAAIQMAVTLASESGANVTGLHVIPEFHVL